MVAVKITAPTCLHTDHDESCLSCLIEDENPDEIEITVRGEFKFTYIYRLPSGMPDGSPEITYWKFDGVRWVSKS